MTIFDSIRKSTSEIKEQIEAEEKAGTLATSVVDGLNTMYSGGMGAKAKMGEYLKSATGWVYGCVGVISDEIAGIELKLLQLKSGEQTEVDDHEALDVIYRANNAMTRFDLINLTTQYLELTGEAPWFISFKDGKPDQIFLLRPDRLTVKPGTDGEVIGGYTYKVYGDGGYEEIKLEPYEVILFKYADPDSPLRGKGPLQAAAITYDLDNYAERWNSQFFRNSATPSAALQTDKILSKDVRNRLKSKLEENYKGLDNAHKTMILENGLKFQNISLSQKDMDFIEQQRFSRDKILAIFRVPRTALGITDDVNRANAEATDYVFAKRTIKPKMIRFVEQLNEFYLPLFGENSSTLFFDFEDPVPQNVDQEINRAQSGVNAGYMTINEAREIMGLDPIEGGDVLRDPMGFAPVIDANGDPVKSVKRSKLKKGTRYQKHLLNARQRDGKAKAKKKQVYEQVLEKTIVPIVYSFLKKKYKYKGRKSHPFVKGTREEIKKAKLTFQDKQLNVADQYEKKMIAKLNQVFEKQRKIVIKQIEAGEKPKLDPNKETERYVGALKSTMMSLMKEQSDLAFQIVGATHPFNDDAKGMKAQTFLQRLAAFFENRTFTFANQVSKETNAKLAAQFGEAVAAGESIAEISKRVGTLFDDMEVYRSERIARTETILSSNFSTEAAYVESGVVEGKEWLATRDERTDDECAELDGKVVELGGKFFKDNYFGGQYPPIHVNCRCTLIPVIGK